MLYEGRDKVPGQRKNKRKYETIYVGNTHLSISILCEDVLENLRNATPCFIVVAHNGGKRASYAVRCSCPNWTRRGGHQYTLAEFESDSEYALS